MSSGSCLSASGRSKPPPSSLATSRCAMAAAAHQLMLEEDAPGCRCRRRQVGGGGGGGGGGGWQQCSRVARSPLLDIRARLRSSPSPKGLRTGRTAAARRLGASQRALTHVDRGITLTTRLGSQQAAALRCVDTRAVCSARARRAAVLGSCTDAREMQAVQHNRDQGQRLRMRPVPAVPHNWAATSAQRALVLRHYHCNGPRSLC